MARRTGHRRGGRGGYSRGMTDYGDVVLSDARTAAMSPAQRRDLIQRLQRPLDEVIPAPIGGSSCGVRLGEVA